MSISIKGLISSITDNHSIRGNLKGHIRNALPIDQADEDSISFCRFKDERAQKLIKQSRAKVIICSNELDLSDTDFSNKVIIQVSNARLTYGRLLKKYFLNRPQYGIHPTSIIDEKAKIGDGVYIGPFCNIGNCEIGSDTVIESHAYIHSSVKIGKRVRICYGVEIGEEGLGYTRNEDQELEFFPQLGEVIIEDDVCIGTNSVIARGALPRSATIIGKGTKLGSMILVAHGVIIGKHCLFVGQDHLMGSVKIGNYTQISTHVSVRQGVVVGNRVLVGTGSVVLQDVPDNLVIVGNPAKPIRENYPE